VDREAWSPGTVMTHRIAGRRAPGLLQVITVHHGLLARLPRLREAVHLLSVGEADDDV
jgi:hypothetical protein